MPLQESITYANVAISLYNDDGQTFIYGYIPIVVAKCGLFLKDNATETEGIFRLSGSAKRIKDLQAIFDLPPKYGKGLDWTGFTVHDAANILRRYLNHLPDPIIPYDWYDNFRQPLKAGWPLETTIKRMQELVSSLPPLNRQLLLYILDLLAVFASKSEINRMTSENLSAIFQPGLITHPRDDMAPQEYKLSQEVLVFLIDNQSNFLLDSLCDPTTDRAPSPSNQKKTGLLRRRTLQAPKRAPSVGKAYSPEPAKSQSRHSPTPSSTTGGLSRSNTVPTKRNPPARSSGPIDHALTPRHASSPMVVGRGTMSTTQDTIPESPEKKVIRSNEQSPLVQEFIGKETHQIHIDQSPELAKSKSGFASVSLGLGASKKHLRANSPMSSKHDLSLRSNETRSRESSTHNLTNPISADIKTDGQISRRTSQGSSSIANDAEFSIIGGRKANMELLQSSPGAPHAGVQRPMSMVASPSVPTTAERSQKGKDSKLLGSSPSKFSNLFKKKPRNQSVSSTSEAGGRRDLDK